MQSSNAERTKQNLRPKKEGVLIMGNKLNIDRMMRTLSEILSEKHGCKVTITAVPKEEKTEETAQRAS